jgi:hypothetical protein
MAWTTIRVCKFKSFDLIDVFAISIAFYNGIVLPFIYFTIHDSHKYYNLVKTLDIDSLAWLYPVYSLVALLAVWLGGSLARTNDKVGFCANFSDAIAVKRVFYVGFFFFITALFLYWIYVFPYGGFIKYLDYSFTIRAGLFEEISHINRSYSFLRPFGSFAFFSTFIFFGLLLNYKNFKFKKFRIFIFFSISTIFSIYVLYSWGGRLGLIKFIISLIFGYYLFRYGRSIKFTSKVLLPILIIIILLPFSARIWGKNKGGNEFSSFIVNELSYPISTFTEAIVANEYRYFKDLAAMPFFLLPERVWSGLLNIKTVSQISTEKVVGVEKGVRGSTITVPVDFVSFGVMQAGIFGVFIVAFLTGYFVKKIDYCILKIVPPGCMEVIYVYIAFNIPIQLVLYSDPKHVIYRNFSLIWGLIFLKLFCRPKSVKND